MFSDTIISMLYDANVSISCDPLVGDLMLITISNGKKTKEFVMRYKDFNVVREREKC
jgi:hypothetical protein